MLNFIRQVYGLLDRQGTPGGSSRGSPRPPWGALSRYSYTSTIYIDMSFMSDEAIPARLFHRLDAPSGRHRSLTLGYRRRRGDLIINTTDLRQATKSELLDAIDQLIMEYAVADMLDIDSKDTE